jgi:DNA invertase Pin-like site-specific DNA recombinase
LVSVLNIRHEPDGAKPGRVEPGGGWTTRTARKLIRSRVEDGTKRARERGVKFGRKPKLNQYQRQQALLRFAHGETQADVARTYGVDRTTICRLQARLGQ